MKEVLSILGAGIMGQSIALTAAWADYNVKIWGINDKDIEKATKELNLKLETMQSNDLINDDVKEKILQRITFTKSQDTCIKDSTYVIEAIPENLELKQALFKELDSKLSDNVILASNTSGLSPTKIAKLTKTASRTVVTHFWNPAHLMPLVEIVRGEHTSDETIKRSFELLESMNKKPIVVQKDISGFVGNRLQYAIFREAQHLLNEDVASIEDIDLAMQYSLGRRFGVTGPFMTMDMGGLDTNASITSYLFNDLSNRTSIFPEMDKLVKDKHFGPKTNKGFYEWDSDFYESMEEKRAIELIRWLKEDFKNKA